MPHQLNTTIPFNTIIEDRDKTFQLVVDLNTDTDIIIAYTDGSVKDTLARVAFATYI